jgi:hypothetical protein
VRIVSVGGRDFFIRLEEDRLCCQVLVGAGRTGARSSRQWGDGDRELGESWAEVLRDLN